MNEARHLESQPASASSGPDLLGPGAEPAVGLPPAPSGDLPEARLRTADLPEVPRSRAAALATPGRPRVRQAATVVLILFLVGLAAFAIGVAIAYAVISGNLDMRTQWVKDVLGSFKDVFHHVPGK